LVKAIGAFIIFGVFCIFWALHSSVIRLGSGFLIGDGAHVFTYYDLVKEADIVKIKFPNEDDIRAEVVFHDSTNNLAVLKLKEIPKVKRKPLLMSTKRLSKRGEKVFTLGYPWTNTLEDQHVLIEGSATIMSMLIELRMNLDPIHSGSPLFNTRQEVVGMVILKTHDKTEWPVKSSRYFAIPGLLLEKVLKTARVDISSEPVEKLSREKFISQSRNNIVLIEAR
jgi:S1-C subfamily serine protease